MSMADPARFDARAAWAALSSDGQRRIGELALVISLAADAQELGDELSETAAQRWQHAADEAWMRLGAGTPEAVDYPAGPDLAVLGIRACRLCGCTETSACVEGCQWIAADLCSSCREMPDGVGNA
jgi:hypothetical protein